MAELTRPSCRDRHIEMCFQMYGDNYGQAVPIASKKEMEDLVETLVYAMILTIEATMIKEEKKTNTEYSDVGKFPPLGKGDIIVTSPYFFASLKEEYGEKTQIETINYLTPEYGNKIHTYMVVGNDSDLHKWLR